MTLLAPTSITRRRYGAQTFGSDGRAVLGTPADTTITASVQPASGRVLQVLSELDRTRSPVEIETHTEILTGDQYAGTPPDRLVIGGFVYVVHAVEDCPGLGPIPRHWYAVALRLGEGQT